MKPEIQVCVPSDFCFDQTLIDCSQGELIKKFDSSMEDGMSAELRVYSENEEGLWSELVVYQNDIEFYFTDPIYGSPAGSYDFDAVRVEVTLQ